ncbi:TPA: hypothetical protein ACICM7_000159, partial [Campylobacter jejuni]
LHQNNFIVDFFKDEQGYNRAFIAKFTNMRYDKKIKGETLESC